MRELNVGSTDDADVLYNLKGHLLQAFFQILVDCHKGGGAERVAGVDANGVNVFDSADSNHLILGVADNFNFKLFPAKNGLFNQALVGHGKVKAVGDNRSQFLDIVAKAAALAAHRVSGTDDKRIADFFCDFFSAFNSVANA